jgi:hypothetical protein
MAEASREIRVEVRMGEKISSSQLRHGCGESIRDSDYYFSGLVETAGEPGQMSRNVVGGSDGM